MDVKLFGFTNLNIKDKPFTLADSDLSGGFNTMLNNRGDEVTRFGFTEKVTLPINTKEVVFYRSKNEIVVFSNPSDLHLRIDIYDATSYAFKRYYAYDHADTGSQRQISQFQNIGKITEINTAEFQENLYFIYVIGEDPAPMLKYDGYVIRSTGLPTCRNVTTSGIAVPASYTRSFYRAFDYNGNYTYSPYVENIQNNSAETDIQYEIIPTSETIGYTSYLTSVGAIGNQVINSSNRVLNYSTNSYKVGDFVFFSSQNCATGSIAIDYPINKNFVILEIESINTIAQSITFKASSFSNGEQVTVEAATNISMFSIAISHSVNSDYGYAFISSAAFSCKDLTFFPINQDPAASHTISSQGGKTVEMETVYDTSTFKYRPPLCRYICSYGDQLVYGYIIGIWANTNSSTYDQFIAYNNKDLIMYSDTSEGDSCESISRINRQLVGNTHEGNITGIFRTRDTLVITKENSLWGIDGFLYSGGYSLRRIDTNNIGCPSVKSFLPMSTGGIFIGNDGIYGVNGFTAQKLTDNLDPFFLSSENNTSRSTSLYLYDKYLTYVKSGSDHYFVVFDYNYKVWRLWKGLNASCGLYCKIDGSVIFSDGLKIYELTNTDDNGVAIESEIQTKHFDLGFPHLMKKFIKSRIIDLNGSGNIDFSVFKNWENSDTAAQGSLVMDKNSKHKYIPLTNGYSCSIKLKNTTSNMSISAMIIEIEPWQANDRNN